MTSRAQVAARLRALPRRTTSAMSGHDLLLYGAGVTFYAALAVVPGLLVAVRMLTVVLGEARVLDLGRDLATALPDELGAPGVALALVRQGTGISWTTLLVAVLPASLYGEGLRRAYAALSGSDDRLIGWR
ncbi:MAG TPA: YhjD/YihY/BrkB family envelope integrity protein, partial [Actinomycetales bacterium]